MPRFGPARAHDRAGGATHRRVRGHRGLQLRARLRHERGYRLCLDGLDEQRLSVADREKLKVDLLKLAWAPTMVEDQAPERTDRLRRMVERVGKPHLILNRVDNRRGRQVRPVHWHRHGQSIGIAMFQGRYVDQLAATRPVTRTR